MAKYSTSKTTATQREAAGTATGQKVIPNKGGFQTLPNDQFAPTGKDAVRQHHKMAGGC